MYPETLQKLIDLFSKLPSVGPRAAARYVFYLAKTSQRELDELAEAIKEIKERIKLCPLCFNTYQGQDNQCDICQSAGRNKTVLCIVEKETDLFTIEENKIYDGLYFILGELIYPKKEKALARIEVLKDRIAKEKFQEIIIAINPTREGEATRLYLERELKGLGARITHLGRGLPIGGELEYADNRTLESAFESRKQ